MSIITNFLVDISAVLESFITNKMTLRADFGVAIISFDNDRARTAENNV